MIELHGLTLAEQNDALRAQFAGAIDDQARAVVTRGIQAMFGSADDSNELILAVRNFTDFNKDNDPHEMHDFFVFDFQGKKAMFKIDYYSDSELTYGSNNPADPNQTYRVMTVMLSSEY